jgi:hypothetical protein
MVFPTSTVISGIFYVRLGDQFDATKLEGLTIHTAIVLPGKTSHSPWAKSSDYITQRTAIGPLGLKQRLEGRYA